MASNADTPDLRGTAHGGIPVTVDNFRRAETERYLADYARKVGMGRVGHERSVPPDEDQPVVRMNRDTLYSFIILDLTTPATVVKPDTGARFQSMMVINQDHYIRKVAYGGGTFDLTQDSVGTRHAMVLFRTFLNPDDPEDVKAAHAVQDGIDLKQASPGSFQPTGFDDGQRAKLQGLLNALMPFVTDTTRAFGDAADVDPVQHLIMTASGWGGNARADAIYLTETVPANDGVTPHVLTVAEVPVDGFWSITVYNSDGYFEAPGYAASVNSVTAKANPDRTVTVHFGGDPQARNYLRIMPGWNYAVRLYRPSPSILDGSFHFPKAEPSA